MHYNFIEIGTSDFNTLLQSDNPGIGLSIEPLKIYLDRLPNKEGVTKVNCAISDFDGEVDIYWIDPQDIATYNLPHWLKGCNSIMKPHPTADAELRVRGLSSIYKTSKCEAVSWDTLVKRFEIESIDYLKIDTEGHDCVILEAILDAQVKVLPKTILFENNALTSHESTQRVLSKLMDMGYEVINKTPDDIYVKLK
jgi:FkbM family methyltransferase